MAQEYVLNFKNGTQDTGNVCVFQKPPADTPEWKMLAWFAKQTHGGVIDGFKWDIQYGFMWCEVAQLNPQVLCTASQNLPCNLNTTNQITLEHDTSSYYLDKQTEGPTPGTMQIEISPKVPNDMVSSGVTMSGNGCFAMESHPNGTQYFTPHPTYWIVFGDMQETMVMSESWVSKSAEVQFPPNVFTMYALLGEDYKWKISDKPLW